MKARNENLTSIDAIMDAEFGKPGTPELPTCTEGIFL